VLLGTVLGVLDVPNELTEWRRARGARRLATTPEGHYRAVRQLEHEVAARVAAARDN
ncbi:MAG: hypothetical protein QOJ09_2034, partial [Actinomycetota bacterium]|nr:hypothetical protein [Actinomycetota bacterium]